MCFLSIFFLIYNHASLTELVPLISLGPVESRTGSIISSEAGLNGVYQLK